VSPLEKALEPVASYDQFTPLADNHVLALKGGQILGYPRT
jgi:hypothetical protein